MKPLGPGGSEPNIEGIMPKVRPERLSPFSQYSPERARESRFGAKPAHCPLPRNSPPRLSTIKKTILGGSLKSLKKGANRLWAEALRRKGYSSSMPDKSVSSPVGMAASKPLEMK
jgi:hypothetical protein